MTDLLDSLDPDTRAGILAYRQIEARQKDDLTRVRKWQWERLIAPRYGTRRQREVVTAELHPSYWPSNLGSERQKVCGSLSVGGDGLSVDDYWAFHGLSHELHPVVWRVTHGNKRSAWTYTATTAMPTYPPSSGPSSGPPAN